MEGRKSRKNTSRGQTLIEVVLAVAVAVIVVFSLVALATLSMNYAQSALRRSEAVKLADAGMEAFRLERDTAGFGSQCLEENAAFTTYAVNQTPAGSGDCNFVNLLSKDHEEITLRSNVTYSRKMVVKNDGADKKDILVTVKWVEGSSERRVTMSGVLSNWR